MTTNAIDHKDEIVKTRTGGLGSSDAAMVARIARRGNLTDSDRQRIAIMLGMEEQREFTSIPTDFGNFIEEQIFNEIKKIYPDAVSNPYCKSESLSEKYGFRIFNHIDYEVVMENSLVWIENKATIESFDETIEKYRTQLEWHKMLLDEKAKALNKKPVLMLSHYLVDGYGKVFIPENLSIKKTDKNISSGESLFKKGFSIISEAIEDFKYEPKEELYADNLPVNIQENLKQIQGCLIQMKEAEKTISDFKEKMRAIMIENNVRSITNDYFKIILVAETMTESFDKKSLEREYPDIASKFTKQSKKNSYIAFKIY